MPNKSIDKPNVLLVADYPNWAYHHIANFIVENLSDEYSLYVDFVSQNIRKNYSNDVFGLLETGKRFARNVWQRIRYQKVRKDGDYDIIFYLGYYFDTVGEFSATGRKIIKGVYTQGFPPRGLQNDFDKLRKIDLNTLSLDKFIEIYLSNANSVVCGAPSITHFYSKCFKEVYFGNSALDEHAFVPRESISHGSDESFVVAWTGTPDRAFKGFRSHIEPAIEKARLKCPQLKFKTRFSGSMKTLPQFYQDVDLIIIASEADAGPSLFAEAALSGIPSISTRVGLPQYVIKDGVNGFLVERDVAQISDKIILLYHNRIILKRMKARIRNDFLTLLGRDVQVENWRRLFAETLSR